MSTTKPVIKKSASSTTSGSVAGMGSEKGSGKGSAAVSAVAAVAVAADGSRGPARSSKEAVAVQKPKSANLTHIPQTAGRASSVRMQESDGELEDLDGYDENDENDENDEYDMEEMEAMRDYENQRMAEVFTQVLATVFTYENITLPETILTLNQALDTHNKTQEAILQTLNKIADKLSK
jgi:hypothetical protein